MNETALCLLLEMSSGSAVTLFGTIFLDEMAQNLAVVRQRKSLINFLHLHFTFMHLADASIQSDLHCIQVTVFWSALAFPGNRTHDLGVASAMLYQLSYRKASCL